MTDDKKRMHWMPLDWPAYWADTRGFDAEHHGAYLMLLGELWMKKGQLRADDPQLGMKAACSADRWAVIGPAVLAQFTEVDGLLTQKRLVQEFERAQKVSAARRAAGVEGAARRWQGDGKPMANATESMANASQNDRQKQTQEQLNTHPPSIEGGAGGADLFARFWGAYPKKVSITTAKKIFDGLAPTPELVERMVAALRAQADGTRWKAEGGRYIPKPEKWLEEGRWQDQDVNLPPPPEPNLERDPALLKLEKDSLNAAKPSAEIKARMAALLGKKEAQHVEPE